MIIRDNAIATLYARWRAEDRALENSVDDLREWMQEVAGVGRPQFREAATRLRPLLDQLLEHFSDEDEMVGKLAEHYSSSSPEVAGVRRQAANDHQRLLMRLDDLIGRLWNLDPTFTSWQEAENQIVVFFDQLEQHEEQESESIKALMPCEE